MDHNDDTLFVLGRKRKDPPSNPGYSSSSSSSSNRSNDSTSSYKAQKTTSSSDLGTAQRHQQQQQQRLPLPSIVTGRPLVIDNQFSPGSSSPSIPSLPSAIPTIKPISSNGYRKKQQQQQQKQQQQQQQKDQDKSRVKFPRLSIPRNNRRGPELYAFVDEIKRRWRIRYDRIPQDTVEWKELETFRKHNRNHRLKQRRVAQQKFTKTYASIQRPKQGFDVEYKAYIMQFITEKLETAEPGNIPIFELPKEFEKKLQYETVEIQIPGLTKRLARTFYPYSKNGFTHNSYRNSLGQKLKQKAEADNLSGATNNPCIKAGAKHGSVIARLLHLLGPLLRSGSDTTTQSFMQHKDIEEIDHCVLRVLKNLDERGAVLLETEKEIFDDGLWYHTPIDCLLWQEPGYYDSEGNEIPEGPQFGEVKSGYEIGDFVGIEKNDVNFQHLPALVDTPYLRAVLQLLTSMITTKMRYDYCPRSGIIIHISPRRGEVSVYGMPKWLADKACVLYIYFCLSQYTPSRHMERIAYGLKIDSPYMPKTMNMEGDLTIMQQIDQGMKSAAIAARKQPTKSTATSTSSSSRDNNNNNTGNYDYLMTDLIDTEEDINSEMEEGGDSYSSSSSSSSVPKSRNVADEMPEAYASGGGGIGSGSSLWEYVLKKKGNDDDFSSDEELNEEDEDYDNGMIYVDEDDSTMDPYMTSHIHQSVHSNNYIAVGSG